MIVSNCPRCCEPLRVPTGELPDNAYAQCPWCRETFPLSDVLDQAAADPASDVGRR